MKRLITLCFLLTFNKIYSQCEYIEDSTALRTTGNVSAPLCNSNLTYCSKNGYALLPHTGYRVLNLMINIVYDINPSWDPYFQATPGTYVLSKSPAFQGTLK